MVFSRNNHFLERIWSADTSDIVHFLSFAKCKKVLTFHSHPFGVKVLSPPPYKTRPLCSAQKSGAQKSNNQLSSPIKSWAQISGAQISAIHRYSNAILQCTTKCFGKEVGIFATTSALSSAYITCKSQGPVMSRQHKFFCSGSIFSTTLFDLLPGGRRVMKRLRGSFIARSTIWFLILAGQQIKCHVKCCQTIFLICFIFIL